LGNNKINLIKTNSDLIKSSINDIKTADKSFLSKNKIKDIMSLLCYLEVDNRKFYIEFFSQFNSESNTNICHSED
jgi:hypothetical protein